MEAVTSGLPLMLDPGTAAERRPDGAEEAFHQGGDGPSADGEEPVQREADGAAGGGAVDGDDQVENAFEFCASQHCTFNNNTIFIFGCNPPGSVSF